MWKEKFVYTFLQLLVAKNDEIPKLKWVNVHETNASRNVSRSRVYVCV